MLDISDNRFMQILTTPLLCMKKVKKLKNHGAGVDTIVVAAIAVAAPADPNYLVNQPVDFDGNLHSQLHISQEVLRSLISLFGIAKMQEVDVAMAAFT